MTTEHQESYKTFEEWEEALDIAPDSSLYIGDLLVARRCELRVLWEETRRLRCELQKCMEGDE